MSKIKNGGLDQYGAEPFEQHLEQLAVKGLIIPRCFDSGLLHIPGLSWNRSIDCAMQARVIHRHGQTTNEAVRSYCRMSVRCMAVAGDR